jgi:hypothetical protein
VFQTEGWFPLAGIWTPPWPSQSIWGKLPSILKRYRQTNRYLHLWACGNSVKSTIRFSRFVPPVLCTWGGTLSLCQGFFWHIDYIFRTLPYLCWTAWGHKSAGPGWSQGLFTLNVFLHGAA